MFIRSIKSQIATKRYHPLLPKFAKPATTPCWDNLNKNAIIVNSLQ